MDSKNNNTPAEVNIEVSKEKSVKNKVDAKDLTPKQIVSSLDQYIIGQNKAKRAVAIALRNRTRRLKLPEEIRDEVAPKNILMIGPTGVGKTEIARRLARLCNAPFLKVEATKYTEVGYVGRDVESMVRDLMSVGFKDVKSEMEESLREKSASIVEERILDLLVPAPPKKEARKQKIRFNPFASTSKSEPPSSDSSKERDSKEGGEQGANKEDSNKTAELTEEKKRSEDEKVKAKEGKEDDNNIREKFRKLLRAGSLEDREVEVSIDRRQQQPGMEIIAGGSIDDLQSSMQNLMGLLTGGHHKKKTLPIKEARKVLTEEVLDSMVDMDKVVDVAKDRVEQSGIIFIDEIDKIAVHGESSSQDVSREGVQRDILPIVEGSNVSTRFGVINTTHILFIAAGAFSVAAPSDLIPELQGRFPLRVELDSLHKEDFKRILKEPKNSLIMQYTALLGTEGVTLNIQEDAIDTMSEIAEDVNSKAENIGARRLHTIMEKVLDEISFTADEHAGKTFTINSAYVKEKLTDIAEDQDLSRYIL